MIDLDREPVVPTQLVEYLRNDLDDLGVWQHRVEGAGNVEVTLVEFAHAAFGHGGLVAAVDLCNVVTLDALNRGIHSHPARKRDCEVVSERAQFAALVLEVVDELAVLAIFAHKNVFELENRSASREQGKKCQFQRVSFWRFKQLLAAIEGAPTCLLSPHRGV